MGVKVQVTILGAKKRRVIKTYDPKDFKKVTSYTALNDRHCGYCDPYESEMDGHPIIVYRDPDTHSVIGIWYTKAKMGSYNPNPKGKDLDEVCFVERDPYYPYPE